jgi:hypothetical protein
MRDFRIQVLAVVAIAAGFGFYMGGLPASPHATAPAPVSTALHALPDESGPAAAERNDPVTRNDTAIDEGDTGWSHGRYGSSDNAQEHWRKHGGDFAEDRDARDYERSARDFVHNPPPDAEIKHRRNGDTLIYEPSTNTFAVENRDGQPRTYFKPHNGERYWDRQH